MGKIFTGWAVTDITPRLPVSLAGQFSERIATEVHSPLKATVLVIQEEEMEATILVSVDTVVISGKLQKEVRQRVGKLNLEGLDTDNIVLMAMHVHTAPYQKVESDFLFKDNIFDYPSYDLDIIHPDEYFELLCARIAQAISDAWNNKQTSFYTSGLAYVSVGHSRMVQTVEGRAYMYGDTSSPSFDCILGVSDPGVELLYFWNEKAALMGVIAAVACPAQVVENESMVSADYWGETRKELNRYFGREIPLLSICSAAGDQSPRDLIRRGKVGYHPDVFEECSEIGSRLARAIYTTISSCDANRLQEAKLKHIKRMLQLPMRTVSESDYLKAKEEYDSIFVEGGLFDPTGRRTKYYTDTYGKGFDILHAAGIMGRWEQQKIGTTVDVEVHCIRIGDTIITTCPFELYIDYGMRIKGRVRAKQVIPAQLACDSFIYLPTKKVVDCGGYGSNPANGLVSPEGGEILTNTLIEWANELMLDNK